MNALRGYVGDAHGRRNPSPALEMACIDELFVNVVYIGLTRQAAAHQ